MERLLREKPWERFPSCRKATAILSGGQSSATARLFSLQPTIRSGAKNNVAPKELRGVFCEQTRMQAVQEGFTPEEGRVDYGGKAQVPCQATIRYEDYREVAGVM